MIIWNVVLLAVLNQLVCSFKQPNIVLMLADDLGWGDVPWHDAPTIAPTLLGLAKSGILLDRYYVQPVCTPTRGALMTGKYPSRIGLQHEVILEDEPYGLPLNETILSSYMKKLGYSVHGIGKWHLGHCSWDHTPVKRGFDSYYGYFNGAIDYYTKVIGKGFDFRYDIPGADGKVQETILWETNTTYSSYIYTQQAKQVISKHDQRKPLFLYLPMQNPHFPAEAPTEYYDMYDGIVKDKRRRKLLAMVSALDDTTKGVIDALKETGLWDNTVFIFFSDNGGIIGRQSIGGTNYPLRGGKASYWEGAIRSASFVHSPLLRARGGVINKELMHVTDWLPTLTYLGACGVEASENCKGPELGDIDGVNQWSTIIGASKSKRTEFLVNFDQYNDNAAIRVGKWKLLQGDPGPGPWVPPPNIDRKLYQHLQSKRAVHRNETQRRSWTPHRDDSVQLYDVEADPYEKNEVSNSYPNVVKALLQRLQIHKEKAVMPANAKSDPAANPDNFGGVWTPWLNYC